MIQGTLFKLPPASTHELTRAQHKMLCSLLLRGTAPPGMPTRSAGCVLRTLIARGYVEWTGRYRVTEQGRAARTAYQSTS